MSKIDYEWVIASVECLTVYDFYPNKEEAEQRLSVVKKRYLNDAKQAVQHHIDYDHRQPDYWLKQAGRALLMSETVRVMRYDEYALKKEEHYLERLMVEITSEQYEEALNVLPPLRHGINEGIKGFFMVEFTDGPYTQQYACIGGKYYTKLVNYHRPATWIKAEMVASAVAA